MEGVYGCCLGEELFTFTSDAAKIEITVSDKTDQGFKVIWRAGVNPDEIGLAPGAVGVLKKYPYREATDAQSIVIDTVEPKKGHGAMMYIVTFKTTN